MSIIGDTSNSYDVITKTNIRTEQIVVVEVLEDSKASEIGMQVNDVVLGINITRASGEVEEVRFSKLFEMTDIMLTVRPGDKVQFVVSRAVEQEGVSTTNTIILDEILIEVEGFTEYKNNDSMA